MNKFDQMKQEMLSKDPSIKTLSLWRRFLIFMDGAEHEYSVTEKDGSNEYTQTAIMILHKGNYYIKRFGKLK